MSCFQLMPVVLCEIFFISTHLMAGAVTLRFDGEVASIERLGEPAFDIPESISIGSEARLRFTFEPIPFPDAAETNGPFISPGGTALLPNVDYQLVLGDVGLSDNAATISIQHDQFAPLVGGGGGGIVVAESITIRGVGSFLTEQELEWSTRGGFANFGSVLEGGEDLSDPQIWNLFPVRNVVAVFTGNGDGLILVTAAMGDASIVPEPSTAAFVLILMIPAFCHRPLRSGYSYQGT